jgi:oligopeptide transport system permease protein
MLKVVCKRVLLFLAIAWVTASLAFFIVRLAPGGPFDRERELSAAVRENLRSRYHLDEPLWKQYGRYMGRLLFHGDLGPSMQYPDRSVGEIIAASFPVSAVLGLFSLSLALIAGVAVGVLAASRRGTWADPAVMGAVTLGQAIPNFVLGAVLILALCFGLGVLPVAGWGGLRRMILPGLVLAAPLAAALGRLVRASLIEELSKDYVRAARARGTSMRRVLLVHALRNALPPVLAFLGPAAAGVLTGSIVVEKLFAIPGLGTHFVNGALNRDHTLITGTVLLYSLILMGLNAGADTLNVWLDPRQRGGGESEAVADSDA